MENGNKPVNPVVLNGAYEDKGLTKREHFAGIAMGAFISNSEWVQGFKIKDDWDEFSRRLAEASVDMADELLKTLEP